MNTEANFCYQNYLKLKDPNLSLKQALKKKKKTPPLIEKISKLIEERCPAQVSAYK